jgi:alpha-ribazole phosphatase
LNSLTKLYLIRHAEVEEEFHRVYGGRLDMGLSPRGHEQARWLAEHLRGLKLDAIYASPMLRVRETLAPLNGHCTRPPQFRDDLREIDFGDWTGLNFQQIRERYQAEPWEWLEWLDQGRMPNAENAAQIRARLEPCLRQILADHAGQPTAIFAHGGVIRGLLAILLDLPLRKMACFDVDYAAVTEVDVGPGRGVEIQLLNYVPWKNRL